MTVSHRIIVFMLRYQGIGEWSIAERHLIKLQLLTHSVLEFVRSKSQSKHLGVNKMVTI